MVAGKVSQMLKDARIRQSRDLRSKSGFAAYQKYLRQSRDKKPKSLARSDSLDSTDKRYHNYKKKAKEADSIFDFAAADSIYRDTID